MDNTKDKTSQVITPESLQTPIDLLKTIQPPVDSGASSLSIIQGIADNFSNLNTEQQSKSQEQTNTGQDITSLINQLSGKEADTQIAKEQTGQTAAEKQISDLNTQASQLLRESQAIPLQVQQDIKTGQRMTTNASAQVSEADRLRENALKALSISQQYDIAKGNYDIAKQKAQDIVDLKYKPIENRILALKTQYELNKDTLDSLDKKRSEALGILIKKQEQELADKKEEEKGIFDISVKLAENGADPNMVIGKAKTKLEALSLAKNALQKKDVEVKEVNGALYAVDKNTLKIKYIGGGTTIGKGVSSAYGDVINKIIGSGKFTKDQANAIRNSISNGEDPFTVVKNQAKSLMTGANQTKVESYEIAKGAMIDLQEQLKQFYALGGKTGIFSGNFEKVVNNLGSVQDPQLVDLATQIQAQLQIYRNAVSGTAYSVQEGKDIASIFPGINKTQGLNTAIINGRLKAFDSTIDSAYRGTLGSSYDKMKNLTTNQAKGNLSDKDFVEKALVSNGINYEKMVNDASKYPGQIPVIDNATGQAGWIPYLEFNSSKYTKI